MEFKTFTPCHSWGTVLNLFHVDFIHVCNEVIANGIRMKGDRRKDGPKRCVLLELVKAFIYKPYSFTVLFKGVDIIMVATCYEKSNDQYAYTIHDLSSLVQQFSH